MLLQLHTILVNLPPKISTERGSPGVSLLLSEPGNSPCPFWSVLESQMTGSRRTENPTRILEAPLQESEEVRLQFSGWRRQESERIEDVLSLSWVWPHQVYSAMPTPAGQETLRTVKKSSEFLCRLEFSCQEPISLSYTAHITTTLALDSRIGKINK